MSAFVFWRRWLLVTTLVITLAGVGLALFGGSLLVGALDPAFHRVFWVTQPIDDATRAYQSWVYGVLGATLAGWGVCLVCLMREALARREPWAWRAMCAGFAAWFVIDTACSAAARVWANVALNVVVLAAVALPLAMTWRARRTDE